MLPSLLTDEEFEKLSPQTQMHYLYCTQCKLYYLATRKQYHLCCECSENLIDPRD
jgi:hypothetical protein